jgi:transposase-like protein
MTSASTQQDIEISTTDNKDWPAIRQAYVGQERSVRAICQNYGIHSQALYRQAGKEGWPRRREKQGDAEQRQSLQLLGRLRRIAKAQIDEIEARRTDAAAPKEPERDARALIALAKLIEHVAGLEAKHQVRRDGSAGGDQAERARRRAQLADKLIAMLEQERGAPLPEGDGG